MLETTSRLTVPVHGLLARICHDIMTDRARLPSMPDVALRIRASMQQWNYTAGTVAKAIQADAGTCAYLVRVANSALYGGTATIDNVEHAVVRLGMDTTRNLVTAYALRAMFKTRSRALSNLMQQSWRGSARLAALASVIAARCPGFDPDRAMLAGLLQDIGALPLINALEGQKSLPSPERLHDTIEAFTAKVGVHLLTHWDFDEDIVDVARCRKDWLRDAMPEADLADLVLVARLHASVGGAQMHELPLIHDVPAFGKLPLGDVGPDESLDFLREAETEVSELMHLLGV